MICKQVDCGKYFQKLEVYIILKYVSYMTNYGNICFDCIMSTKNKTMVFFDLEEKFFLIKDYLESSDIINNT